MALSIEEKEWLDREGKHFNSLEIQIVFLLKRHNPRMPMEYHAKMLRDVEGDLNSYFIARGKNGSE